TRPADRDRTLLHLREGHAVGVHLAVAAGLALLLPADAGHILDALLRRVRLARRLVAEALRPRHRHQRRWTGLRRADGQPRLREHPGGPDAVVMALGACGNTRRRLRRRQDHACHARDIGCPGSDGSAMAGPDMTMAPLPLSDTLRVSRYPLRARLSRGAHAPRAPGKRPGT